MKKSCPRCNREFDADQRFCPHDGAALRFAHTVEIVPNAVVGQRYEIRRKLGVGGMGVVFEANDIRLDRRCALKVLRDDALADPAAVARFHREATQASRIQHPNTVAIYNFDETEDRLTYLAMEYVEGETLYARLRRVGVLSPRPAARIVWQIANVLGAAHELKIVHRDLKPANIMLTRYRKWDDFVKVVDFGIAKAFGTTAGEGITTRGNWIGTPEYMSPEQWIPGREIDHRSDIFSLGLITVCMLAGGFPSTRTAPTPAGNALMDALPPNDWPQALWEVLARCTAEWPEHRFQTAAAFAAALVGAIEEWVAREPGVREMWDGRIRTDVTSDTTRVWNAGDTASVEDSATRDSTTSRSLSSRAKRMLLAGVTLAALFLAGMWSLDRFKSDDFIDDRTLNPDTTTAVVGDSAAGATTKQPSSAEPLTDPQRIDPQQTNPPPSSSRTSDEPSSTSSATDPRAENRLLTNRLEALLSPAAGGAPPADSVRQALALARGLLGRDLGDSMRVEVVYHLAEAEFQTGAGTIACRRLREIAPVADTMRYLDRSIAALLVLNCGSS